MKKFVKAVFTNGLAISFTASFFGGFSYGGSLVMLFWASIGLTLINIFLKPFIKLILLPINLVTLGALRWLTAVVNLLVLTVLFDGVKVTSFDFPGLSYQGFALPAFYFSPLVSLVVTSLLIWLSVTFVLWLFED